MSDFRRVFRLPLTKHPLVAQLWLEGREAPFRDVHWNEVQPPYLHLNVVADNNGETRLLFHLAPREADLIARGLFKWARRAKRAPNWIKRWVTAIRRWVWSNT